MTKNELSNEYFEWMYGLVYDGKFSKKLSYRKLLSRLHELEFRYIIDMDSNRAEDGVDLRYRFGYEKKYSRSMISEHMGSWFCSVLEMIIALAMRCEEHIMDDSDIGNRTGQWFWNMIVNLGLGAMNDTKFDRNYVDNVISRFLNREYETNGEGGLFTTKLCKRDLRSIEIWYQMCWYLDEVI